MTDHDETADPEAEDLPVFERHRALVRETDKDFATVYGAGGAGVLGTGAIVIVVAWIVGALGSVLPWMLAVTATLIALFVLRGIVNKRRAVLRDRVHSYCQVNDLDWQALRDYYAADGIYPYFLSVLTDEKRA